MNYSSDQVLNGIMNYADHEVLQKLPTSGKWILGTGIGVMGAKANNVVVSLQNNSLVKTLGVVDEHGMWDVECVMREMKEAAEKYGKVTMKIPFLGDISFDASDIDVLKSYIVR